MVAKFRFSIFFLLIFLIIILFSARTEAGCWKITDRQGNVTIARDIWHFKKKDDKVSYIKGWVNSAYAKIPIEKIHSIEIQKGWDSWHTIFSKEKGWGVGIITLRSGTKASFASYYGLNFISEFGEGYILMSRLKSVTRCDTSTLNKSNVDVSSYKNDVIIMKNGDILSGTILTSQFILKTSYADLTIEAKDIDNINLEGSGQNIETITLKNGDRISGILKTNIIEIKLPIGTQISVDKDKIKLIRFKKTK